MKRFFCFALLLWGCLIGGLLPPLSAATVTGTMIDLTGSRQDGITIMTPDDAPRHTSGGTVLHTPVAVQSVDGVYVFPTVVQGAYRLAVNGQTLKHICVPAGGSTYSVHLGQLDCGTRVGLYLGDSAGQLIVSTNDTAGYLKDKLIAGTNVVLVTQNEGTTNSTVQINSIALSGAEFDTNTLTLTFTGSGGGSGGGGSVGWGDITGLISDSSTLTAALDGKQDASSNLDDWSALATSAKQDASGNLTNWSLIATTTKQPASANLTNWAALSTTTKQPASANLTNWSAITTGSKQDSSANLTAWSAIATSTKQAADVDLNSLSAGITGIVLGAGNGNGYAAAVSGTDYAPPTSGSSILSGNGSGGFSSVTIGSGLTFSTGTLTATATSGGASLTNGAASKAVVTDSSTNLTTSATTATELSYVAGVTSAIQTQLGNKQAADVDLNWLASGNTGVIKGLGNGSGYTNAVAGTDYIAPGPVSTSGLTVATNNVLLGETTGAGSAPDLIVIGNGLSLTNKTLSLITNLMQVNIGQIYITNSLSSGSMVVTNGITNQVLSAGGMVKAGTDKALATATAGVDYQAAVTTNVTLNCFNVVAYYDGFFNKNAAGTKSTTDGVLMLLNWGETDFTRLVFGQSVSTNASIKKSGSALQVRTGDDSADAPLSALYFEASDGFFGVSKGGFKSWQDSYVTLYNFSENGFTELQFGGTNSAPAMRPNSTGFSDVVAGTAGATPTFRLGSSLITAKTTNYTLTAADSRTHFTNAGASGTVNFTLPTWASGLNYTFTVTDAQTLTVTAPGADTIRIAGSVTAAGGNVTTNVVGNSLSISAVKSGKWLSTTHEGVWTVN